MIVPVTVDREENAIDLFRESDKNVTDKKVDAKFDADKDIDETEIANSDILDTKSRIPQNTEYTKLDSNIEDNVASDDGAEAPMNMESDLSSEEPESPQTSGVVPCHMEKGEVGSGL